MLTVSVVIPCYNAGATLERALESVRRQTMQPLEVIVVDDASADQSAKIVDDFRAQMQPVSLRLVRLEKNSGAAVARNTGWDLACGDLVAFLDADDSWHPKKLELQTAWMAANPAVPLSGHAYAVRQDQSAKATLTNPLGFGNPKRWTFKDFLIKNRISTPTVMLRRALTERFPNNKRYCEDYDLWLRISHKYGSCAWSDVELTYLHKNAWGVRGLSGDLWPMYQAEMDCYADCYRQGWISWPKQQLLQLLSSVKHARRLIKKSLGLAS